MVKTGSYGDIPLYFVQIGNMKKELTLVYVTPRSRGVPLTTRQPAENMSHIMRPIHE